MRRLRTAGDDPRDGCGRRNGRGSPLLPRARRSGVAFRGAAPRCRGASPRAEGGRGTLARPSRRGEGTAGGAGPRLAAQQVSALWSAASIARGALARRASEASSLARRANGWWRRTPKARRLTDRVALSVVG